MDLLQEWSNMNVELTRKDTTLSGDVTSIQKSSTSIYLTLLKNLGRKMIWIRVISGFNLLLAFIAPEPLRYIFLGIFLSYELGRFMMGRLLKKLPNYMDYSAVTRNIIAYQLELINKILKTELIWSYIYGPFAGPSGFMAYMFFKHGTFGQIMAHQPNLHFVLLGLALLTFPIAYLGSKMNRLAFGKDIEKLTAHLIELEKGE